MTPLAVDSAPAPSSLKPIKTAPFDKEMKNKQIGNWAHGISVELESCGITIEEPVIIQWFHQYHPNELPDDAIFNLKELQDLFRKEHDNGGLFGHPDYSKIDLNEKSMDAIFGNKNGKYSEKDDPNTVGTNEDDRVKGSDLLSKLKTAKKIADMSGISVPDLLNEKEFSIMPEGILNEGMRDIVEESVNIKQYVEDYRRTVYVKDKKGNKIKDGKDGWKVKKVPLDAKQKKTLIDDFNKYLKKGDIYHLLYNNDLVIANQDKETRKEYFDYLNIYNDLPDEKGEFLNRDGAGRKEDDANLTNLKRAIMSLQREQGAEQDPNCWQYLECELRQKVKGALIAEGWTPQEAVDHLGKMKLDDTYVQKDYFELLRSAGNNFDKYFDNVGVQYVQHKKGDIMMDDKGKPIVDVGETQKTGGRIVVYQKYQSDEPVLDQEGEKEVDEEKTKETSGRFVREAVETMSSRERARIFYQLPGNAAAYKQTWGKYSDDAGDEINPGNRPNSNSKDSEVK